jgi:hypothetical protein
MPSEYVTHIILSLTALVLFILSALSYWKDRHPRFRWVCLAFATFLLRQLYVLRTVFAGHEHGLPLVTDTLDLITIVLFFLAVKA